MTSLPENGALAPSRGASRRCSPRARPRRTRCASTSTRPATSSFRTCRPKRAIAGFPAWAPTSRARRAPPARARPRPQAFPRSTPRRSARATTCGARSSPTSFPQRKSFSPEARALYANGAPVPLPEEQSNAAKYQERIARLRQSVQLHERNIEALKKELANTEVGRAVSPPRHRARTRSPPCTGNRRRMKLRFFPSSATASVAKLSGSGAAGRRGADAALRRARDLRESRRRKPVRAVAAEVHAITRRARSSANARGSPAPSPRPR